MSRVSTTIRDNNDESLFLSNRGNTVAVISDSTRVLGDGNVTPPGGLGVMEGKAMLMKYLVALTLWHCAWTPGTRRARTTLPS